MVRYEDDYPWTGTREVLAQPGNRGMDPNFRGGKYRGERMQASQGGQAPYGRYRQRHAGDLQGYGGFEGRYRGYGRDYDRGYRGGAQPRGRYDREYGAQTPGGLSSDLRYLRDFNKNSPALRGEEGRQGERRRSSGWADDSGQRSDPRTDASRALRYDEGYNRYGGYSAAGFAEGWLPKQAPRGHPMRHTGGK